MLGQRRSRCDNITTPLFQRFVSSGYSHFAIQVKNRTGNFVKLRYYKGDVSMVRGFPKIGAKHNAVQ